MRLGRVGWVIAVGAGAAACGGMTGIEDYSAPRDAGGSLRASGGTSGGGGAGGVLTTGGTPGGGARPPGSGAVPGTGPGTKPIPVCGNRVIDPGEACDGPNLAGQSCASTTMGARPNGTLACSTSCMLDARGCVGSGVGGFPSGGGSPGAGGFGAIGSGGPPRGG